MVSHLVFEEGRGDSGNTPETLPPLLPQLVSVQPDPLQQKLYSMTFLHKVQEIKYFESKQQLTIAGKPPTVPFHTYCGGLPCSNV